LIKTSIFLQVSHAYSRNFHHFKEPHVTANKTRRWLALHLPLVLAASTCLAPMALAQDFPNKPLRLVVPFPAGGPTDMVARPLGLMLGEALKQTVLIERIGSSNALFSPEGPPAMLLTTHW